MSYNRRKTLAQLVTEATGNDRESKAFCGKSLQSMIEDVADCVEFVGKTVTFSEGGTEPGVLMVDPLNFEKRKHFDIQFIKSNGVGGFWMLLTPNEDDYKKGAEIVGKIHKTFAPGGFVSPGIFTVEIDQCSTIPDKSVSVEFDVPNWTSIVGVTVQPMPTPDFVKNQYTGSLTTRKISPDFKERVIDILSLFLFEYNDELTRDSLMVVLTKYFNEQFDLGYAIPQITISNVGDDCGLSIGLLFQDRKYYDFFLSKGEINVSENPTKEISIDGCIGINGLIGINGENGNSGPDGICIGDGNCSITVDTNKSVSSTGSASWIVCGSDVATMLQNTAQFINTHATTTHSTSVVSNSSLTSIGTISGFQVYADPNAPADTILLGHKGHHQKENIIKQMIEDFNKGKIGYEIN